jgi:uncharacterized protein YbjT (DUF2867 family)
MGAVVVFGATGGVGRHAVLQLLGAGQEVIAVVRDPSKGTPLANAGARVVTHDLQHDDPRQLARHLKDAESVLFAAGVRYGAPLAQLEAIDRGGAVVAVAAARELGADRFVQVSAIGADSGPPPGFDDAWWTSYYAAKHAADDALRTSRLRWTVIRPGHSPTRHRRVMSAWVNPFPCVRSHVLMLLPLGSQSSATRPASGTPGMQLPGPSRFVTPSARPS